MAGSFVAVAGLAPAAPDGQSLVRSRCTKCHSLDRIAFMVGVKDKRAWQKTVFRMAGNGARVNRAEQDAVVEYLSGLERGQRP